MDRPRRIRVLLLVLGVLLAVLVAQQFLPEEPPPYGIGVELRGGAMGELFLVRIPRADLTPESQARLGRALSQTAAAVDGALSGHLADGEIARFNRHASSEPFRVSEATAEVVRLATGVGEALDGAFDVTLGQLVNAWGVGTIPAYGVPHEADLAAYLRHAGYRKLHVLDAGPSLVKDDPALLVDLGAIGRGYAVDRLASVLDAQGFRNYFILFGGEARGRGLTPEGRPWELMLPRPHSLAGRSPRSIVLDGLGASSGGTLWSARVDHAIPSSRLLDPRTGRPFRPRLRTVTVAHAQNALADAYATGLDVLPTDDALAVAERLGLAVLIVEGAPGAPAKAHMTAAFRRIPER